MKVVATHYICIKDKEGKDLLVMRRGDEKSLNKKESELITKEADGKYETLKEKQDEKNQTK
jgi:hypothetical protein